VNESWKKIGGQPYTPKVEWFTIPPISCRHVDFSNESHVDCDENVEAYSGSQGPQGIIPHGQIIWRLDHGTHVPFFSINIDDVPKMKMSPWVDGFEIMRNIDVSNFP